MYDTMTVFIAKSNAVYNKNASKFLSESRHLRKKLTIKLFKLWLVSVNYVSRKKVTIFSDWNKPGLLNNILKVHGGFLIFTKIKENK